MPSHLLPEMLERPLVSLQSSPAANVHEINLKNYVNSKMLCCSVVLRMTKGYDLPIQVESQNLKCKKWNQVDYLHLIINITFQDNPTGSVYWP